MGIRIDRFKVHLPGVISESTCEQLLYRVSMTKLYAIFGRLGGSSFLFHQSESIIMDGGPKCGLACRDQHLVDVVR